MTLNNSLLLVGFGPRARVGKDYAAYSLRTKAEAAGFLAVRVAFADKLKADLDSVILENFGFSAHTVSGHQKALIRPVLVAYGSAKRDQRPDHWVEEAFNGPVMNYAKTMARQVPALVTVADVRFENEVQALKALGGIYIHLTADVPYVNEEEKATAPLLEKYADATIHNYFDESFGDTVLEALDVIKATNGNDFPKF